MAPTFLCFQPIKGNHNLPLRCGQKNFNFKSNQLYWLTNNGTVKRLKPCKKSSIKWGNQRRSGNSDGHATSRDRLKAPNDGVLAM